MNREERIRAAHQGILETYEIHGGINHIDETNLPSVGEVVDIIKKTMFLLFPGFYNLEKIHKGNLESWSGYLLDSLFERLYRQITKSICFVDRDSPHSKHVSEAERVTLEILESIPKIRSLLKKDVSAAYFGDPAARNHEEVILSYPSVQAVAMYRFAHEMYLRDVPLIPRMISEYAHGQTGIDIHPGARIGESFFIDHGTGVVIGETCVIGERVKIYQGVTLGALSFKKDVTGALVKGLKRHPTIEDDVILYAGCNILGGTTTIGKGSVIGGNVWITESVEPGTVITFDVTKQEYRRIQKGVEIDLDFFLGSGI
ncbi:MAG: serine O-acetyltransferase EpsC [bacterium]|nr:serine O-acetyltransferase EpsC [bacterium]